MISYKYLFLYHCNAASTYTNLRNTLSSFSKKKNILDFKLCKKTHTLAKCNALQSIHPSVNKKKKCCTCQGLLLHSFYLRLQHRVSRTLDIRCRTSQKENAHLCLMCGRHLSSFRINLQTTILTHARSCAPSSAQPRPRPSEHPALPPPGLTLERTKAMTPVGNVWRDSTTSKPGNNA